MMLLKALLFAYVVTAAMLYVFQRALLYHPARDMASPAVYGLPMKEITLTPINTITLAAWYTEPRAGMPTVLFAHGNAGHLGYRAEKFQAFMKRGFGLLAVSYRGYGTSEGSPTEQGLYEDMRAGLRFLADRGVQSKDVVMYGESLGTGAAVELATDTRFRAVILEAPFTSVTRRAAELYRIFPARWMVRDRFDSLSKIKRVASPLLVLHGARDTIVPAEHGKTLYAAAREPKTFVLFEDAGHNDLDAEKLAEAVAAFVRPNS